MYHVVRNQSFGQHTGFGFYTCSYGWCILEDVITVYVYSEAFLVVVIYMTTWVVIMTSSCNIDDHFQFEVP